MAARRSGFSSLVHRHQLQDMLSSESKAPENVDKPPSKERGLRTAFGNEDLGRLAKSLEESHPWSAPALDLFFGPKQEVAEKAKASNWNVRPRPPNPTLSLVEVTEQNEKHFQMLAERAKKASEDAQRAENEGNDAKEAAAAEQSKMREANFAEQVEKKRTTFFGRPSQQIRLLKRKLQIQRNKVEHYCAMWKHLLEEANEEHALQKKEYDKALTDKKRSSEAADNLRGQERGARLSAIQLKAIGLIDASEQSLAAAEEFAAKAKEKEQEARIARALSEDSFKNMGIEEEKQRACRVQINYNRREAKRILDSTALKEREEVFKVIEEAKIIQADRVSVVDSLNMSAPLSSLAKSFQDDVDTMDRRLALLEMEQEMFRPFYIQAGTGKSLFAGAKEGNVFMAVHNAIKDNGSSSDGGLVMKRFEWKEFAQRPGTVCLGRRGEGPDDVLYKRCRVVSNKNQYQKLIQDLETLETMQASLQLDSKQKDWVASKLKVLFDGNQLKPEKAFFPREWDKLGEEVLPTLKAKVEIFNDYFAKEDPFESSEDQAKGIPGRTILDNTTFTTIWVQREVIESRGRLCRARKQFAEEAQLETLRIAKSHEIENGEPVGKEEKKRLISEIDRVNVKLRHEPKHLWMTSWVEPPDKATMSVLNNNPYLGPKRLEMLPVRVPALRPLDSPEGYSQPRILDTDGRPRAYAILWEVVKKLNDRVNEGDVLIRLKVFDDRKMTPEMKESDSGPWADSKMIEIVSPAAGRFTGLCPAIWKQKTDNLKDRKKLELFDWNAPKTHGFQDQTWVQAEMKKPPSSRHKGLLRNYNLKFFSFEIIGYIDQGESDWDKKVLPVDEWPEIFVKDFKFFFYY